MKFKKIFVIFFALFFSASLSWAETDYIFLKDKSVQLFFIDPLKNKEPKNVCENDACRSLLYLINRAEKSIDFAIYGIGSQDAIFNALVNAQKRGVLVRGVVDAIQDGTNIYNDTDKLKNILGNIKTDFLTPTEMKNPLLQKYQFDITKAIMHNKFFIIDNQYVWTGSTNVSSTCMNFNANNAILINSFDIAKLYSQEFNQMYEKGLFHDYKSAVNNNTNLKIDKSITISVYFLPIHNPVDNAIIPLIRNAKKSVDVEIFYLTHKRIINELIRTHNKGVKIRVIADASSAENEFSKFDVLKEAGIQVKTENWAGKMHKKSMIIDNNILVLGSMNWTTSAQYHNDENVLVIESNIIANESTENFNYLWKSIPEKWLVKNPKAEGLDSKHSCFDGIDNDHNGLKDIRDPNCNLFLNIYQSKNRKLLHKIPNQN